MLREVGFAFRRSKQKLQGGNLGCAPKRKVARERGPRSTGEKGKDTRSLHPILSSPTQGGPRKRSGKGPRFPKLSRRLLSFLQTQGNKKGAAIYLPFEGNRGLTLRKRERRDTCSQKNTNPSLSKEAEKERGRRGEGRGEIFLPCRVAIFLSERRERKKGEGLPSYLDEAPF